MKNDSIPIIFYLLYIINILKIIGFSQLFMYKYVLGMPQTIKMRQSRHKIEFGY